MGIVMPINGHFLPKRLVITPKITLPNTPPMYKLETIQENSSIVIFPDANGVLSDINIILGLGQPAFIPDAIDSKFTI